MAEQVERLYTDRQVVDALEEYGLDVHTQMMVLAALRRGFEQKKSEDLTVELAKSIVWFAVVYERATAENASDSNIESWNEDLIAESVRLLGLFAEHATVSEEEILARDTAALAYLYLTLEIGSDGWDAELLVNAGLNLADLLKKFKEGVISDQIYLNDRAPEEIAADVDRWFPTLDDFKNRLYPNYWKQIVQPTGFAMRSKLLELGYELPALNEVGKYDDEDDKDGLAGRVLK